MLPLTLPITTLCRAGDNVATAAAIARQAGILPRDAPATHGLHVVGVREFETEPAAAGGTTALLPDTVMEGEEFRSRILSPSGAIIEDEFLKVTRLSVSGGRTSMCMQPVARGVAKSTQNCRVLVDTVQLPGRS